MSATCGCCAGIHSETPRAIVNRPGLSVIQYRAGDFTSFKRSMLAALTKTRLTTRDDDDFSIALLDAWAMAADVLTFYQERIANESYLTTAGERDSVLRLARLVGYELGPGVAAMTHLAFFVDTADGAPKRVTIEAGSRVQSVPGQDEEPRTFETIETLEARVEWNELHPRTTELHLPEEGDTDAYVVGTGAFRVGDALMFAGADAAHTYIRRITSVDEDHQAKRSIVRWSPALETFENKPVTGFVMRVVTPLFGHNAADPRTLSEDVLKRFSLTLASTEWPYAFTAKTIDLDGPHPEIRVGSKLVLVNGAGTKQIFEVKGVQVVTIAAYAMVGKATRLTVDQDVSASFAAGDYRATMAFAADEPLDIAERPKRCGDEPCELQVPIELDTHVGWVNDDKLVLITGISPGGSAVSEVATVESINVTDPAHTKLVLPSLSKKYLLDGVRIYANVAVATDGETVREVLGSGDAAAAFQTFRLSHKPLTYVYATGGTASTLQVFVNEIRWHEVETLYAQGPNARVFVTRHADDGTVTVQFGNGVDSGARLPTGSDNVRAVYRKGTGSAGNLAAGKLTLLLSRPLGLSGATNPQAAEGGADPELMKNARRNAPRTVVTLDRVVSLADYQAYAASFPGIAKSLSTWTMTGAARQVFLTVAGSGGKELDLDSITVKTLRQSLVARGDPYVPLRIASFERAEFVVKAVIGVHPDRLFEEVMPRVKTAMWEAFSFDAREFGQAVDLSDVITVIQNVDGVVSVDVEMFCRFGDNEVKDRLTAALPRQDVNGTIFPAEILVLKTASILEAK
jgi:predicted phage baseplate assembly protein